MMPELSMADALGAAGKPILRVHTAGSRGRLDRDRRVQPRRAPGSHRRVLTVAYEKQAEGNAQWGLAGGKSGGMGAGGIFAPWMRSFMARTGSPAHIGPMVAVKDRRNAAKNPYAHLQMPDLTDRGGARVPDAVGPDPLARVVPVVRRRVRDGDDHRGPRRAAPRPPAWVLATAMRSRAGHVPGA